MNKKLKPTNILILTGAGISAESGIKTFRDKGGLWEGHNIYDVASPSGFNRDPDIVNKFYNMRRQDLLSPEVKPNEAHIQLTRLQKEFKGKVNLVTQNVDDLHERSGFRGVIHMHGELLKMRCIDTGKVLTTKKDISHLDPCPCCLKVGNLRPHIVWFGEYPLHMDEIGKLIAGCDLFISIGTSGQVYPAAMYVELVKERGIRTIEVNLNETQISKNFDEHRIGQATVEVSKLVQELLS